MHWEAQYRKVVEELCIRGPIQDSTFVSGPKLQRQAVSKEVIRIFALCIERPKTERLRKSRRASGGPIQNSKVDGLSHFVSGAPIQRKASGRA
jgi:hypothetical protein